MNLTSGGSNGSYIATLAVAGLIIGAGLALGWITRPQPAENSVSAQQAPSHVQAPSKVLDKNSPFYWADQGYQSCLEPNESEKSCQGIASFGNNKDGTWLQEAVYLVDPRGPITLQTYSRLYIKNGKVCTKIHKDLYAQAQLRFRGGQILRSEIPEFYDNFERSVQRYIGKEACTHFEKKGTFYQSQMKIEGHEETFPMHTFKWIPPGAGYRLAPYQRVLHKARMTTL